jgi:short-subunit dehydrogenase
LDAGTSVVITGATAGVGRALSLHLAREGHALGLIARDPSALEQLRDEIAALGVRCEAVSADVADPDQVFAAADRIAASLGPIGLWINNAMVTVFGSVGQMTPAEIRRVTEVTYLGFVHGTMAALRHMQPRNAGTIVQIGSALAYRGIPLQSAYCGAKHAIRGFTDSLRCELIHERSRIALTMIQLPAVNTPQFDWGRTHRAMEPRPVAPVTQPEAVAAAIVKGIAGGSREVWIGLSSVEAILGSMALPGWLDHYLARKTVSGQDRDTPVAPDRRDNLLEPVSGFHRLHGAFDREARDRVRGYSDLAVRLTLFAACIGLFAIGVGVALAI